MIGTTRTSPQRIVCAALLPLLLGACGGGGGGSSDAAPTIVTASFVGAGATPVAGDALLLVFSETVGLAPGSLLTDADFVLSGGASLGAVTAAPASTADNVVTVTLGAGVDIVPGTTTIALGPANDAVRDSGGKLGTGGAPVTIGTSDGVSPVIGNLTLAGVDGQLNGTGPAGGVLQVPRNGWTIDLTYSDNGAIATGQTQITASVPVGTAAGTQPAGTNLVPFLTAVTASNTAASYRVPAAVGFPNGTVTLSCLVVDASGLASVPRTFTATVRAFTAALQPFETTANPSQVWYLDFARDVESYNAVPLSANPLNGARVDVVAGASGRSDFEDLLFVLGLQSSTPLPAEAEANTLALQRLRTELLDQLAALYDGANVGFTLTRPAGDFGSSSSVPYPNLGYSQISIAGAASVAGVLGLAIFDPSNTTQNDNTLTDFPTGSSTRRLGVFLHTIIDAGLRSDAANQFRTTFDPFAPVVGGDPIGSIAGDRDRLLGVTAGSRTDAIDQAIHDLARFTAVVTAHECGHSVGLVENGPMPIGLYGNDPVNFPGSIDGHIKNGTLFPVGTNVMSPALSWDDAVDAASAFNSLNRAYLREQVFYGN